MTERCHEYVGSLALALPATRIANFLPISDSTVERIVRTQRKILADRYTPYCPSAIGIDEVRIRGQYRNIIVDLDRNIIIDLLRNHEDSTLHSWLNRFGSLLPNVEFVTMDQTDRYRKIFQARCPNAEIVYDKFHFVRLINRAIGKVYVTTGTVKSTRTKQSGIQRRVLCAREANLDIPGQLMLNGILSNNKDLKIAHDLKEDFHRILTEEHKSKRSARAEIKTWLGKIPVHLQPHFEKVISAADNWRPQVVAMLLSKRKVTSISKPEGFYTNSPTEGLNRMVKLAALSTPSASFEQLRLRLILVDRV